MREGLFFFPLNNLRGGSGDNVAFLGDFVEVYLSTGKPLYWRSGLFWILQDSLFPGSHF